MVWGWEWVWEIEGGDLVVIISIPVRMRLHVGGLVGYIS